MVGKSALTIRLTQSEFPNEYDPTIEDSYRHHCTINGEEMSLDILDTAGQEEYSSMRDLYMKTGQGFLLVFSLVDHKTFDEISTFYNQIMRVKGERVNFVPLVLVGNKNDLEDQRQVSKEEGIALAKKFDAVYIETSAKTGENVEEAFYGLVKVIMHNAVLGSRLTGTLYPSDKEEKEAEKQEEAERIKKLKDSHKANSRQGATGTGNVGSTKNQTTDSNTVGAPGSPNSRRDGAVAPKSESGGCCVIV